eukprot:13048339-Ditylum_brightwellii.AAC.1
MEVQATDINKKSSLLYIDAASIGEEDGLYHNQLSWDNLVRDDKAKELSDVFNSIGIDINSDKDEHLIKQLSRNFNSSMNSLSKTNLADNPSTKEAL